MNLFSYSSDVHIVSRELNSTVNKLIYIPKVKTSTYGIDSIRYQCATLWNKFFKKGEINVDDDKKNNMKLSKIKNKKSFNWTLKKHFLHSYTIVPTVIFYWNSFLLMCFPSNHIHIILNVSFRIVHYILLISPLYLNNSGTFSISYLHPPQPPPPTLRPSPSFPFFNSK